MRKALVLALGLSVAGCVQFGTHASDREPVIHTHTDAEDWVFNGEFEGKTLRQWLEQLACGEPAQRAEAAEALGRDPFYFGGMTYAIGALAEALKDGDPRVRRCASAALGKHERWAQLAIPDLMEATEDADVGVAEEAGEALEKIDSAGTTRRLYKHVRSGMPTAEAIAVLTAQAFECHCGGWQGRGEPFLWFEKRVPRWRKEDVYRVGFDDREGKVGRVEAAAFTFSRQPIKERLAQFWEARRGKCDARSPTSEEDW